MYQNIVQAKKIYPSYIQSYTWVIEIVVTFKCNFDWMEIFPVKGTHDKPLLNRDTD